LIKHDNTIPHIVERDAKLGLTLADFVEQSRILHSYDRLGSEALQKRNLPFGKRSHFKAIGADVAEQDTILSKRQEEHSANARFDCSRAFRITLIPIRICPHIGDVDEG